MTDSSATRERLLAAAAELFAQHGFHGTKARDIAQRGGVNLAASNYHYGSKRDLYFEVLRSHFAEIRGELERRGANLPKARKLSRRRLEDLLRARSLVMVEMLLGPPPSLHAVLMQREMCDPSEALPIIVEEFVRPLMDELAAILAELAPEMSERDLQLSVFSIVGQALFYHFAMPALLQVMGSSEYPPQFAKRAAAHIAEFSLGGLQAVARKGRHGR